MIKLFCRFEHLVDARCVMQVELRLLRVFSRFRGQEGIDELILLEKDAGEISTLRKEDIRLHNKGNSDSNGASPVY
jgi:hypothetical protein